MIPSFAFLVTDDGARLLHRAEGGWHLVGDVNFEDPDLDEKIGYLRRTAARLEPKGMTTKLVIPDSQIHFARVEVPSGFPEDAEDRVREYLAEATPYAIDELAYDWRLDGEQAVLAAVARETLGEAEAFAAEHRLSPVAFVACPADEALFPGEPFFDESIAARALLGETGRVEREDVRIKVLAREDLPAVTAATIEIAPDPDTVAAFSTRRRDGSPAGGAGDAPAPEFRPTAATLRDAQTLPRGARIAATAALARAMPEQETEIAAPMPEPEPQAELPAPPAPAVRGPNRKRARAEAPEPPRRPTSFLAPRPDDSRPEGFRHFGYQRPVEVAPEEEPAKPRKRRKKRAPVQQEAPAAPVTNPIDAQVAAPQAEPEAPAPQPEPEVTAPPPASEDPPSFAPTSLPEPASTVEMPAEVTEGGAVDPTEGQTEPVEEQPDRPIAAELPAASRDPVVAKGPTIPLDPTLDDVPPMPVVPRPLGTPILPPRGKAAPILPPERVGASVVPLRKPVSAPDSVGRTKTEAAAMTVFGARPKPKPEKAAASGGLKWFGRALVAMLALLLFGAGTLVLIRAGVIGGPDEVAVAPPAPAEAVALPDPIEAPSAVPVETPAPVPPPIQILPALQVTEGTPPPPLVEPSLAALPQAATAPPPDQDVTRAALPVVFEQLANVAPPTPVIRTEIALGSAPAYQADAPAETTAPPVPEILTIEPPLSVVATAPVRENEVLAVGVARDAMIGLASTEPAAPLPSRDPLDRAASGATAALIGATNPATTRAATEAFYAVTGVWPGNPAAPALPPRPATPEILFSAIAPTDVPGAGVAIPQAEILLDGTVFVPPPGALPPVTPTPEGALSRDGVLLFAGRPPAITRARPEPEPEPEPEIAAAPEDAPLIIDGEAVVIVEGRPPLVPPLRPGTPAPEAEVAATPLPEAPAEAPATADETLADEALRVILGTPPAIPPTRPADAAPEQETAALEPDLTPPPDAPRPILRPASLTPPAPATAPDPAPDAQPAVTPTQPPAETLAPLPAPLPGTPQTRPAARPFETVTQAPPAEVAPEATVELAGNGPVVSIRPVTRPAGLARAVAANPRPETTTAAPPVVTTPSIPTRASVARQATEDNGINLSRINLIGVYGAPSDRRALVRLPTGRYVKVQVGDRVDGGQVAAIGESELRYVKSGRDVVLRLPPS